MASTSIGSILAGAFGQLRRHPLPVLLWCMIYVAAMIAMLVAMRPMFDIQSAMLAGGNAEAAAAEMMSMMGWFFLLQLGLMVLMLVLFMASLRASLRPEDHGFGYLKFGRDEFHGFIIGVIAMAIFIALYIGAVIVIAVTVGASLAMGGATGAVVMGGIGFFVMFALLIWFQVRLSLAFPLSVMERRLVIVEGWRASRGHFWTLFGGFMIIAILMVVVTVGIAMLTMGPYFAAMGSLDPVAMGKATEAQMAQQFALSPMSVIGFALNGLVGGVWIALAGGGLAAAARDLSPQSGIASTFS